MPLPLSSSCWHRTAQVRALLQSCSQQGGAVRPFLVCVLHPVSHHPAPAPLADMSDSPPPLMRSDLGTQLLVEGKLERESAELGAPKT